MARITDFSSGINTRADPTKIPPQAAQKLVNTDLVSLALHSKNKDTKIQDVKKLNVHYWDKLKSDNKYIESNYHRQYYENKNKLFYVDENNDLKSLNTDGQNIPTKYNNYPANITVADLRSLGNLFTFSVFPKNYSYRNTIIQRIEAPPSLGHAPYFSAYNNTSFILPTRNISNQYVPVFVVILCLRLPTGELIAYRTQYIALDSPKNPLHYAKPGVGNPSYVGPHVAYDTYNCLEFDYLDIEYNIECDAKAADFTSNLYGSKVVKYSAPLNVSLFYTSCVYKFFDTNEYTLDLEYNKKYFTCIKFRDIESKEMYNKTQINGVISGKQRLYLHNNYKLINTPERDKITSSSRGYEKYTIESFLQLSKYNSNTRPIYMYLGEHDYGIVTMQEKKLSKVLKIVDKYKYDYYITFSDKDKEIESKPLLVDKNILQIDNLTQAERTALLADKAKILRSYNLAVYNVDYYDKQYIILDAIAQKNPTDANLDKAHEAYIKGNNAEDARDASYIKLQQIRAIEKQSNSGLKITIKILANIYKYTYINLYVKTSAGYKFIQSTGLEFSHLNNLPQDRYVDVSFYVFYFHYDDVSRDPYKVTASLETNIFAPKLNYIAPYANRLYGVSTTTDKNKDTDIYNTNLNNYAIWNDASPTRLSDTCTGIIGFSQGLLAFTKTTTTLATEAQVFSIFNRVEQVLSYTIGCVNHYSCKIINNMPIWMSVDGICVVNNGQVQNITENLLNFNTYKKYRDASGIIATVYKNKYILSGNLQPLVLDFSTQLRIYYLDDINYLKLSTNKNDLITTSSVKDNNSKPKIPLELYLKTVDLNPVQIPIITKTLNTFSSLATNKEKYIEYLKTMSIDGTFLSYISPIFTEGDSSILKNLNHIYIHYLGIFEIRIYTDDFLAKTHYIYTTSRNTIDLTIPHEHQRAYTYYIEINGYGIVYDVNIPVTRVYGVR